jgi:hypothetical protein
MDAPQELVVSVGTVSVATVWQAVPLARVAIKDAVRKVLVWDMAAMVTAA